jgi:hypothetical protein
MMTVIEVGKVVVSSQLAGGLQGQAVRPRFEQAVGRAEDGDLLVLDFSGIELVTPSYLRSALGWVWRDVPGGRELFPVVANLGVDVREDVELALTAAEVKAVFGRWDGVAFTDPEPVNLDAVELDTFRRVAELEEAAAVDLYLRSDRTIQPTAWSNRLAGLHRDRLLRRRKHGRRLLYSLPWRT